MVESKGVNGEEEINLKVTNYYKNKSFGERVLIKMIIKPTEKQVEIYNRNNAVSFKVTGDMFESTGRVSIDISPFQTEDNLDSLNNIGYVWVRGGFSRNLKGQGKVVIAPGCIDTMRLPQSLKDLLERCLTGRHKYDELGGQIGEMELIGTENYLRTLEVCVHADCLPGVGRKLLLHTGYEIEGSIAGEGKFRNL